MHSAIITHSTTRDIDTGEEFKASSVALDNFSLGVNSAGEVLVSGEAFDFHATAILDFYFYAAGGGVLVGRRRVSGPKLVKAAQGGVVLLTEYLVDLIPDPDNMQKALTELDVVLGEDSNENTANQ